MSDKEAYETAMRGYQAAILQRQAEYQKAQIEGDVGEQAAASMEIARLNKDMTDYHAFAVHHVRSQATAAPPQDKYGLTETEREAAKNWTSDNSLSEDDRMRIYSENKRRYAALRAGGYRDELDLAGKR